MRIRKSLAALALIAGATAGGLATAGPASASAQNGLVNVYAQDILSGNQIVILQNVPITVAANVCGLNVNVLSTQLLSTNQATCVAQANSKTNSWVSYS
jgi:hypothetical protein